MPHAAAAPTPPPNPTNGQISAAANNKNALATRVGQLSGEIAQAQVLLQQLQGQAELAEQKYAYAMSLLQIATDNAKRANAAVAAAKVKVEVAHTKFVQYVQATYMSGGIDGTAGTLLTAGDPSSMLAESALAQFQQSHQVDAIGALQKATVARSNAEARARQAVQARTDAAAKAQVERVAAHQAFLAQQQQKAALEQTMAAKQKELDAAQLQLADLNHQRSVYLAFQAEQARIRAARAAAEAAARARAARARQNAGGGGGGGSGPPPPSGGGWTPEKGQRAARRALSQLGVPYAWAGGGAWGTGWGVCDPGNGAPNDCNVRGFDCSGLAMYAWGINWAHFAATQYSQAGSYHPGANDLRAGDLVFWSNGGVWGIHHVAVYIGGGQIVEAPYSGGFVQVASLWEYGSFFGATRPLT